MADLLGVPPHEVSSIFILDYCYADDRVLAENHIDQNLRGRSEQYDFRLRRSDGSAMSVLACTSPVRDVSETVIGALGMYSDITARMQAEQERNELLLRVQEARDIAEAARHRLSLLAAVSQSLAEAGNDLQAVVESSTRETAETLGDGCVLRLTGRAGGAVAVTAVYHRDPAIRNTPCLHDTLTSGAHAADERQSTPASLRLWPPAVGVLRGGARDGASLARRRVFEIVSSISWRPWKRPEAVLGPSTCLRQRLGEPTAMTIRSSSRNWPTASPWRSRTPASIATPWTPCAPATSSCRRLRTISVRR